MVIIRSLEHDVAQAVVLGLKIVNKRTCLTSRFFYIAGTIVKDNEEDRARLRRYFEQRVATHKEAHWQAYYQARHRLP